MPFTIAEISIENFLIQQFLCANLHAYSDFRMSLHLDLTAVAAPFSGVDTHTAGSHHVKDPFGCFREFPHSDRLVLAGDRFPRSPHA
jgi:hypothetical protein